MKTLKQDTVHGITFTMKETPAGYTVKLDNGRESALTEFPNEWDDNKGKAEAFYQMNFEQVKNIG